MVYCPGTLAQNYALYCMPEKGRRFADRMKTILLLDDGLSFLRIAGILLSDDLTIRDYKREFSDRGISSLRITDYKAGLPNLSVEQEKALKENIVNKTYSSSTGIIDYVKQTRY